MSLSEYNRLLSDFVHLKNNRFEMRWGYVPAHPSVITMITSMFLHGGIIHLAGNMIFFFAVGFSLEDLWGRGFFACFYLASGVAAVAVHHMLQPGSLIPMIGASGAVAGVMGAYLIRLYRSKIKCIYLGMGYINPLWFKPFMVPAYVYLPLWFILEYGYAALFDAGPGVAHWAHVGGFGFGMIFALGLKLSKLEEKLLKPSIDSKIDFGSSKTVVEALEILKEGDVAKAEMMLNSYNSHHPNDIDCIIAFTRLYEQKGDQENLRQAYSRLIHQYILIKEFDSAVVVYDSLLGTYEESEPALPLDMRDWMALCDHLVRSEMYQAAAIEYRRSGRTRNENPFAAKAFLLSGEIFLEKLLNNRDAAISFVEARNLNPTQPQWIERISAGIEKIKEIETAKTAQLGQYPKVETHAVHLATSETTLHIPPDGLSL